MNFKLFSILVFISISKITPLFDQLTNLFENAFKPLLDLNPEEGVVTFFNFGLGSMYDVEPKIPDIKDKTIKIFYKEEQCYWQNLVKPQNYEEFHKCIDENTYNLLIKIPLNEIAEKIVSSKLPPSSKISCLDSVIILKVIEYYYTMDINLYSDSKFVKILTDEISVFAKLFEKINKELSRKKYEGRNQLFNSEIVTNFLRYLTGGYYDSISSIIHSFSYINNNLKKFRAIEQGNDIMENLSSLLNSDDMLEKILKLKESGDKSIKKYAEKYPEIIKLYEDFTNEIQYFMEINNNNQPHKLFEVAFHSGKATKTVFLLYEKLNEDKKVDL